MTNQQSAPQRYWILKDTAESNLLLDDLGSTESKLWIVEPNSYAKPQDVAYFWRKENPSSFYGWGIIESAPAPLLTKGHSKSSSEPRFGVQVRHHVVFPSPVMFGEMLADTALKALSELSQVQENIIELTMAQAAALNRLIRRRDSEAPPDPPEELSEQSDEENGDTMESLESPTLSEVLESYSLRDRGLSDLSRAILYQAAHFASMRERNRDKVTTDCLLFATCELGRDPSGDEADNAAQFLFYWIERFPYARALSDFLDPIDPERKSENVIATPNVMRIIEAASRIAMFVRKETVTSARGKINARDLVGAMLYHAALNGKLYAARRLTGMDVNVKSLLADYVNNFLDSDKNPDDDIEKWREVLIELRSPQGEPRRPAASDGKSSLPSIDADTPSVKQDLLNIAPEVEGFAKIIAARDVKTPLSIGLFGDWGSGKSTFMEQLQATVEKIAKGVRGKKENEETSFLGNIVQIKFNAWHYAEANLWASLVSHVFDNLSFSEKEEKEKKQERKKLFLGRLVTGLAAQKAAEADVKYKETKYENAKAVLDGAMQEQLEARLERRDVVINGIWPIVREFLSRNDEAQQQLDAAAALLGKAGLTEEGLKREIEASRTTLRRARWYLAEIRKDPRRWLYVILILILMLVTPIVLTFVVTALDAGQVSKRVAEFVTPFLPLIVGALTWLGSKRDTVRVVLDKLEAASSQLDEIYKNARKEYDERLSLLNKEVATKKAEVNDAKGLVEKAKTEVAVTLTMLREMEPARLLQTFVQERASSEDYRKLLGVIALIRRDFKKLSDLLGEQDQTELRQAVTEILKDEAQKENEEQKKQKALAEDVAPAAGVGGDSDGNAVAVGGDTDKTIKEPSKEMVDERLKDFRIDRIVLYIDDLDRCPPKQVVDVLQAIHLLLAFELFVVVVGVDARWIRHSLRERFPEMLSEDWDDGDASKIGEKGLAKMATPRDYVEKIFQVPFWLKPMDDDSSRKLLEGLIPVSQLSQAGKTANNRTASDEAQSAAGGSKGTPDVMAGKVSGVSGQRSVDATPLIPTPGEGDQGAAPVMELASRTGEYVEEFEFVLKPESLSLDLNERNAMVALSRVIGKTPRTLKRFVNVYRIIKAGLNGADLQAFVGTGPSDAQYRAVLVLLSVAHGAPDVAPTFFREIKKTHDLSVTNKEKDAGIKAFLKSITKPPSTLDECFQSAWSSLIRELEDFAARSENDIPIAVLREWLPVIVRYTFQLGRLSEEVANRKAR